VPGRAGPNGDRQQPAAHYNDTIARHVDMFDFDLATVTIGNREHLIEFRDGPGVPDGMAVDAQGLSFALTRVLRGFRSVNSEDS